MGERAASRQFTWDDIAGAHDLIARRWAVDGPRARMHVGDFYWALRPAPNGDPLRDLRLWPRPDGLLAAYAWSDRPDSGEVVVRPGSDAALFDEALDWLEGERGRQGGGAFSIGALDGDDERIDALERRGYVRGEGGGVRFWRRLDAAPASVRLPAGFSVRHVSSESDIKQRVFVQRTSFERSSATTDVWQALRRLAGYNEQLDLIAVAPDGTGASACTCWYDEANRCGEFEPVGTSKAYQRMGAGKAVILEGLSRLRGLGATQAIVQTNSTNAPAIALYRSCGFEPVGDDRLWAKTC